MKNKKYHTAKQFLRMPHCQAVPKKYHTVKQFLKIPHCQTVAKNTTLSNSDSVVFWGTV
jgi:hypothetical protein